ncbi:WD repeat-containing protein 46 [Galendromus occidentalis]|uniref:WD repeat-containing protein 46 n=1 Tax=Galendromus occidentalis TaxID=34638 RepID=A0AAJ7P9T0_9ACAR|nr:WD repeat-containing protein 46 [Galendromus occidentalis]
MVAPPIGVIQAKELVTYLKHTLQAVIMAPISTKASNPKGGKGLKGLKKKFKASKSKILKKYRDHSGTDTGKDLPQEDPFPGEAPVSEEAKKKFGRVDDEELNALKKNRRAKFRNLAKKIEQTVRFAARSEILLPEDHGYLEAEKGEKTYRYTQNEIQENVDITSASKRFTLDLSQFGPYVSNYSREGRHLLLGGRMGHLAAFDWLTKKLLCEINVMESVHAVQWLHQPTMFAAAQKKWTYIYDTEGIELHCLKALNNVTSMEFLPYHFLLAAASESGFLHWVDISIGTMVGRINTKTGRIPFLRKNPTNGIVLTGHQNGVVRMWSPNSSTNVVELLAHKSSVTDVVVDRGGSHMITSGLDRSIKIWDLRMLRPMHSYTIGRAPTHLALSDKKMLAVTLANQVEIYRDILSGTEEPYLRHQVASTVMTAQFCPFEDVLGLAHGNGFDSILVPGSAEANFDSYEINPLMNKKQRREAEVKLLLNKIQPEMICLDPDEISQVDVLKLRERIDASKQVLWRKPRALNLDSIMAKRKGTAKVAKAAKQYIEAEHTRAKREFHEETLKQKKSKKVKDAKKPNLEGFQGVLARFQ